MIYRSGINCGYLRLPEVVTPYTQVERTRRRMPGGNWKNQVEFIVTIDVDGAYTWCSERGRTGEKGDETGTVYKFLRLPMKLPKP